jgi:hypothetical protein
VSEYDSSSADWLPVPPITPGITPLDLGVLPDVNPDFAAFKKEMAEMVMDTCGVPEDLRQLWRDLR